MKNILITGGNGMLGSHIDFGFKPTSKELNLKNYDSIVKYITDHDITELVHAAGKVGGVRANDLYTYDFLIDNLDINMNIIKACKEFSLSKTTLLLSTCIFPVNLERETVESDLHTGEPHPTNTGYSYAKRFLEIGSRCLNKQFGIKSSCIVPCNMYGFNDNYDLENSHVIPGLIHKCYLAQQNNTDFVIWGSGKGEREFLFAGDMAKILKTIHLDEINIPELMIVSPGQTHTIKDVVDLIVKQFDFKGKILFDTSKPEGAIKKSSSNKIFRDIFPTFKFTDLENGLAITIEDFVKNYIKIRK